MSASAGGTVAERLGRWISGIELEEVPSQAVRTAKEAILDFIGVTLAGSRQPIAQALLRYEARVGALRPAAVAAKETSPEGARPCSVIGLGLRLPSPEAAMVNGALGHALDFDDSSDTLGGHPSAPVFPAALAAAQMAAAPGRDLLVGYIAGFEVETKLGRALNFTHYDRGWHPTATLGTFGAVAAAARILRLTPEATAAALAIAASRAAGIKQNFGTMTKPLQVGLAAANGLSSVLMAEAGFTAHPEAFEGHQGFGAVYNGPEGFRFEALELLGQPWDLVEPGLVVKQYPCCGSTHPAVDAIRSLQEEHALKAEEVERVRVRIHPRRLRHTNRPRPETPLEAKFSVQYAVAAALCDGCVRLHHFTDEALSDPRIGQALRKVEAEPLPPERWGPEHFAAEVEVEVGGRRLSRRVEKARGRGPRLALSREELEGKFFDCASQVLSREQAVWVRDRVGVLESLPELESLVEVLAGGGAPPARA